MANSCPKIDEAGGPVQSTPTYLSGGQRAGGGEGKPGLQVTQCRAQCDSPVRLERRGLSHRRGPLSISEIYLGSSARLTQ